MQLAPRYDGPPVLRLDDLPTGQLAPTVRQRRRFTEMLSGLDDDQWRAPSRCAGWSVRDVVAHLVTVNSFWDASVAAGVDGEPTRMLVGFDPAASPRQFVAAMADLGPAEVLSSFVATNESFLARLERLGDAEWSLLAEAPPGHLPIRQVAQHALWDSWVHERDVAVPLGLDLVAEPDEVAACLQYAAALSPALGTAVGQAGGGTYALRATDPDVSFSLAVGDTVVVDGGMLDDAPCLRGDAVALVEALSLRAPLPPDAPEEWRRLLAGIETAFDA